MMLSLLLRGAGRTSPRVHTTQTVTPETTPGTAEPRVFKLSWGNWELVPAVPAQVKAQSLGGCSRGPTQNGSGKTSEHSVLGPTGYPLCWPCVQEKPAVPKTDMLLQGGP